MNTKLELFESCLKRYLAATKQGKQIILDELTANSGMHRKSVIRQMNKLRNYDPWKQRPKKRGRKVIYGPMVNKSLREVWRISSELCAERLHPEIKNYITPLQRDGDWKYDNQTTELLLKMSLGTMKDRLKLFRSLSRNQRCSTTKPSSIKSIIPIRRGSWDNPRPGYGEIYTLVHCGSTLAGDMAYTVNYTDIITTWTESSAQMNKGQNKTIQSIESIKERLPFPLLGLDPDNGSEFINWNLKGWCDKEKIEITRSRPNHKNDNAHIEQKNHTAVRNFLGYQRIDTDKQIKLMNQLYNGPLRLYINFFQPSMKCIKKVKIGSRYIRKFDKAKTPYQRVLNCPDIDQSTKDELTKIYQTLNPLKLKREIDTLIEKIFKTRKPNMKTVATSLKSNPAVE